MLKSLWGEIPSTPEAREWVRNLMEKTIWTVKDVQAEYGLSQSTISRLYTKYDWEFAFKKSSHILFLAEYAKPWFDQYNAKQNENRSRDSSAEPKKKRPGRPSKTKSEDWRRTTFQGWEIVIGEEFASAKDWVEHVHTEQMKKYNFGPAFNSPEHLEWVKTWRALRVHFNIPDSL